MILPLKRPPAESVPLCAAVGRRGNRRLCYLSLDHKLDHVTDGTVGCAAVLQDL